MRGPAPRGSLGLVHRVVQAELLDHLPPASPEARRSRGDLVRVNALMRNHAWFARVLPPLLGPGEPVLELGAGDGALALRLRSAGLRADALDRQPAPDGWPAHARWHRQDLRAFAGWPDYPAVAANLVLHHFSDAELAALGAALDAHARVLVLNEPLRRLRVSLLWRFAAPLGGAGPVTRHDGRVSIRAGFRAGELPRALGLSPARWTWRARETVFGACRLVAVRRP